MTDLEACAYLRPIPGDFWSWGDDGRVLLWADGRTVAFLPEVETAARRLAPAGLPPFPAIVAALAATRGTWADGAQRTALSEHARAALSIGGELPGFLQELLRDALARLDAIAALPEDVRKGPESRALLLEMLFEGTLPMVPRSAVAPILDILAQRVPVMVEDADPPANLRAQAALALLKAIAAGRLLADAEAIRMRQRTGLEQTPKAPQLHVSEIVRGLLNQLRGDPQLAGLAKLARAVLAVIATPRRLQPETELPLGGVSDIANRGPLDRLLLSELAYDDLTLAVRVALHEALYLRRESPRSPQTFTRVLVLDAGIRLWGVPRVFAAAVALAFAASTPREAALRIVAPHGAALAPVDLTTREGLLAHLERLEPDPHPAAAMPALAKLVKELPDQHSETVLVTHPDTAADADLQTALQSAALHPHLLATVAATGRFVLESCSAAGRKPLAQAVLSLDDLIERPAGQAPLIAPQDDLPAYFSLFTSPFRLPTSSHLRDAVGSPRHGLIAIQQRRLVHWPTPGRPRQLFAPVPQGNLVGLELVEEEGQVAAVVWDPLDKVLHAVVVEIHSAKAHVRRINGLTVEPLALASHRGSLLVLYTGRVDAYNLRGVPLGSLEFPSYCRILGRRFLEGPGGNILAIVHDPSGMHLLTVPVPPPTPIAVFDRIGVDGPLVLYGDGAIRTSTDQTIVPAAFADQHLLRFSCQVSNDGARISVDAAGAVDTVPHGVDLSGATPAWQPLTGIKPDRFLLGPLADYAVDQRLALRRRMQAIFVGSHGELVLVSHRNKMLALQTDPYPRLVHAGRYAGGGRHYRTFKELATPQRPVHGLALAAWGDGSRAYLDPRGFLHLRSSDPAVPELSILLAADLPSMPAWAANGKTFGPKWPEPLAILHEPPTGQFAELAAHLRAFVGRLT